MVLSIFCSLLLALEQTLLNLVSTEAPLQIHLPPTDASPPRVWLSTEAVDTLHNAYHCTDVLRKGKQLCMVLQKATTKNNEGSSSTEPSPQLVYLFLHMGMTGSIRTPGKKICLGHGGELERDDEATEECYPPKFAYLTLECAGYKAAFCDPRKFGKCILADNAKALDELAPDAWLCTDPDEQQNVVLPKLAHQTMGIKGVLLDQKRACSGVGNWVADEVLYQCRLHPDQTYLTAAQATELWKTLQQILDTAVDCLTRNVPYPSDWLFPYRWTGKQAGSKDALGRSITFLKSGGRTSAIIATVQKLHKSQGKKKSVASSSSSSSSSKTIKAKQQLKKEEEVTTKSADPEAREASVSKKRKVEMVPSQKVTPSQMAAAVVSSTTIGNETHQGRRRRSPRRFVN
jgi:formamidopyrimidine-DNA glycosylase